MVIGKRLTHGMGAMKFAHRSGIAFAALFMLAALGLGYSTEARAEAEAGMAGKQMLKTGAWPLWEGYMARFLVADDKGELRVVDPQGGDRTTSEGQSYAMFFALVNNRRDVFDHLLHWTENNLASGDIGSHLPAWLWGRDAAGNWRPLDTNSASDSDLWIAYDLAEAGRLWKEPSYTQTSQKMLRLIAAREVVSMPGFGLAMLPSPQGFAHNGVWVVNPSYMPPFLLSRLAAVEPKGPWRTLAAQESRILQQSSQRGFAMDWVSYQHGPGFHPSAAQPDKAIAEQKTGHSSAVGSYDAIRVYLWAGMTDADDVNRSAILKSIGGMHDILSKRDAPPEKISPEGVPSEQAGPVGFSATMLPYLEAYSDNAAITKQVSRIEMARDSETHLYGKGPDGKTPSYYDQNLILFGLGWTESRFRFSADGRLAVGWEQA